MVPVKVMERIQKVATSADKCLKDSPSALKLFDHDHMSLMANKDSEKKSLGVVMCEMQAVMTPIQQVLLVGTVHAPDNSQTSNVDYLNVKLADLVQKMKACFEKVEFTKAISQKLKSKKDGKKNVVQHGSSDVLTVSNNRRKLCLMCVCVCV